MIDRLVLIYLAAKFIAFDVSETVMALMISTTKPTSILFVLKLAKMT
jgi:hypothetical protein